MTLKQFIKDNRGELDKHITRALSGGREGTIPVRLNDQERRLWILNDIQLYDWARLKGVKL